MESRWIIPRFTSWLYNQHQREDLTGRMGMWIASNKNFPSCATLEKFLERLYDFKNVPRYFFDLAPLAYEEYLAYVKELKDTPIAVRQPKYAPPPPGASPPFMLDPVKKQYVSVFDFLNDEQAQQEYDKYLHKKYKRCNTAKDIPNKKGRS